MQIEVENTEYLDRQRRGRLMLLCMLIFFITPIIAVIAMYKLDWRPKGESIGDIPFTGLGMAGGGYMAFEPVAENRHGRHIHREKSLILFGVESRFGNDPVG